MPIINLINLIAIKAVRIFFFLFPKGCPNGLTYQNVFYIK